MTNKTNILFIIFVVIFLGFGYFWYARIGSKPTEAEVSSFSQEKILGREFMATVDKIRTIKLDTSFFEKESFTSLKDLIPEIEEAENIGRKNPFLPIE